MQRARHKISANLHYLLAAIETVTDASRIQLDDPLHCRQSTSIEGLEHKVLRYLGYSDERPSFVQVHVYRILLVP